LLGQMFLALTEKALFDVAVPIAHVLCLLMTRLLLLLLLAVPTGRIRTHLLLLAVSALPTATVVAVGLSVDAGDSGGVLGVLELVSLLSRIDLRLNIIEPVGLTALTSCVAFS